MSSRRARAFSLIETMIAAALLGVIASAVVVVVTFAAREAGGSRYRTIAATNARESLDRIHFAIQAASHHGRTDADLCALLRSTTGPMDSAAPATVTGACPNITVSGIRIPETTLTRTVILAVAAGPPVMVNVTVRIFDGATQLAETSTQIVRD